MVPARTVAGMNRLVWVSAYFAGNGSVGTRTDMQRIRNSGSTSRGHVVWLCDNLINILIVLFFVVIIGVFIGRVGGWLQI